MSVTGCSHHCVLCTGDTLSMETNFGSVDQSQVTWCLTAVIRLGLRQLLLWQCFCISLSKATGQNLENLIRQTVAGWNSVRIVSEVGSQGLSSAQWDLLEMDNNRRRHNCEHCEQWFVIPKDNFCSRCVANLLAPGLRERPNRYGCIQCFIVRQLDRR